jgi:hypothetical protein
MLSRPLPFLDQSQYPNAAKAWHPDPSWIQQHPLQEIENLAVRRQVDQTVCQPAADIRTLTLRFQFQFSLEEAGMSTNPLGGQPAPESITKVLPPDLGRTDGVLGATSPLDEVTEKRLDDIEMIGDEEAAGWQGARHSEVSAGMRYLHSSRTIHQLVTDRNRAVGIYLAVASLLWTASGAILNAKPTVALMVPIETIQFWALPVTFGILTVLAVLTGFLLIRTRIGLIYEVAKMNVLLGLPVGRVKRLGFLSIFFIMHLVISLAGGGSALLFSYFLLHVGSGSQTGAMLIASLIGVATTAFLLVLYIVTVLWTTSDRKLSDSGK